MSFWSSRRVMVTGDAGFLGRHVVSVLQAHGAGEISIPRSADDDLRMVDGIDRAMRDGNPDVIRRCPNARDSEVVSIDVWGTGTASREFLYIEDAAKAIVLADGYFDQADAVNLGVGAEITIRELVTMIAELTGFMGEIRWDPEKPDGQPRRALDTSRARDAFGFEAGTPFPEGLQRTSAWYQTNRASST